MRTARASTPILFVMSVAALLCACGSREKTCDETMARFEADLAAEEARASALSRDLALPETGRIPVPSTAMSVERVGQETRIFVTADGVFGERAGCLGTVLRSFDRRASRRLLCDPSSPWSTTVPPIATLGTANDVAAFLASRPSFPTCDVAPAVLYVAADAPLGALVAVLAALARAPRETYAMLRTPGGARALRIAPVAVGERRPAGPHETLDLSLALGPRGITIEGSGGRLAPGCDTLAPPAEDAVTVPRAARGHDWPTVQSCLARVEREFPDDTAITIVLGPTTTAGDAVTALAVGHSSSDGELFPDQRVVP